MIPFKKFIRERSKAEIQHDITSALPGTKANTGNKQEIRVQPVGNTLLTDEDLRQAFAKIDLILVKVVSPKTLDSKSSKFPTFVVKDKQGTIHYVVLGKGAAGNAGMDYERRMSSTLKTELQNQDNIPFYKQLKAVVGPVQFVDVKPAFEGHSVRRQLTDKPHNAGEIISDLTLIGNDGKPYYISLKNIDGLIIANNSLKGMFKEQKDGTIKVSDVPSIDPLLSAVHLDKMKVAKLIEDFTTSTPSGIAAMTSVQDFDSNTVRNYIASAFDYGYYYVRELKNSQFEVKDLTTLENLYNYIGNVTSVSIGYPFYAGPAKNDKRKTAKIAIETDTGRKFLFSLRNKMGGIVPRDITLTKFA
jgi:hypothetical protein